MSHNKLHIHATIGPDSFEGQSLGALLSSGINAIRVNMSHMDHEKLPEMVRRIRSMSDQVQIGADIKGRKLRIGPLPEGDTFLKSGDTFTFIPVEGEEMGGQFYATVNYPKMAESISPDTTILLDDGIIVLRVKEICDDRILCMVERGGTLFERCGLNIPGHATNLPGITMKDCEDLDILSELNLDFVYLSFVETGRDIELLRSALHERNMDIPVISKIELSVAVENLDGILEFSYMICIARGDLGVEVPMQEIPYIQRRIINSASSKGVPVLLAGEVLYSLVKRHIPYRSELTDVVIAVEQGINGFILSDETAIGVDPANAVKILRSLISEALKHKK